MDDNKEKIKNHEIEYQKFGVPASITISGYKYTYKTSKKK